MCWFVQVFRQTTTHFDLPLRQDLSALYTAYLRPDVTVRSVFITTRRLIRSLNFMPSYFRKLFVGVQGEIVAISGVFL